jgi:hypothetical protein
MKWMLVVMILGSSPVKTDLVFGSLDECLKAEDVMRGAYVDAYNAWQKWAKANPADSSYPNSEPFMQKRGLHWGTCIPHAGLPS